MDTEKLGDTYRQFISDTFVTSLEFIDNNSSMYQLLLNNIQNMVENEKLGKFGEKEANKDAEKYRTAIQSKMFDEGAESITNILQVIDAGPNRGTAGTNAPRAPLSAVTVLVLTNKVVNDLYFSELFAGPEIPENLSIRNYFKNMKYEITGIKDIANPTVFANVWGSPPPVADVDNVEIDEEDDDEDEYFENTEEDNQQQTNENRFEQAKYSITTDYAMIRGTNNKLFMGRNTFFLQTQPMNPLAKFLISNFKNEYKNCHAKVFRYMTTDLDTSRELFKNYFNRTVYVDENSDPKKKLEIDMFEFVHEELGTDMLASNTQTYMTQLVDVEDGRKEFKKFMYPVPGFDKDSLDNCIKDINKRFDVDKVLDDCGWYVEDDDEEASCHLDWKDEGKLFRDSIPDPDYGGKNRRAVNDINV
jgi:hypothetical protein